MKPMEPTSHQLRRTLEIITQVFHLEDQRCQEGTSRGLTTQEKSAMLTTQLILLKELGLRESSGQSELPIKHLSLPSCGRWVGADSPIP